MPEDTRIGFQRFEGIDEFEFIVKIRPALLDVEAVQASQAAAERACRIIEERKALLEGDSPNQNLDEIESSFFVETFDGW